MSDTVATLPPIDPAELAERRQRVFLVLAGIFLCAMTMLNVIGITRFIQLGPMALAVGVLPYPLTFLCTDLVCEIYGKARANFLVTVGLGLNVLIIVLLTLGNLAPSVPVSAMPPWQLLDLASDVALPNGEIVSESVELCLEPLTQRVGFYNIGYLALGRQEFDVARIIH